MLILRVLVINFLLLNGIKLLHEDTATCLSFQQLMVFFFFTVYGFLDKAAMSSCKWVFAWTYISFSLWEMPRSDIVSSYGNWKDYRFFKQLKIIKIFVFPIEFPWYVCQNQMYIFLDSVLLYSLICLHLGQYHSDYYSFPALFSWNQVVRVLHFCSF